MQQAIRVASRKTKSPVILKIKAKEAHLNTIKFYKEDVVWLCDFIPSEFIIVLTKK